HDQIIRGKLHAQLARRFDEREVLVGEREDGNLREVDFLLAREDEQQVERSLETFHVDDERRLVGGALRRDLGIKAELFFAHERPASSARTGAIMASNRRRASTTSISGALRRQASAAAARRAAAPASGGAASATSYISSNRPLQWSTTSQ